MSIGTIILGLILIAAGALCAIVIRNKLSAKALDIQYMKTTPLKDLKAMFDEMAGSGLGGNFRQYVELAGVSASAAPPRTPYSQQDVAYYTADLVQVYETQEYYKDSEGRQKQRTVRREETVSSEKSTEPMLIKETATGETVSIDPQEGGFDLMQGYDRFEAAENMDSLGFFSAVMPRQLGNRTLGYRMLEKVIPLGQPLYVLGEAYLRAGSIFIGHPQDRKKSFVVSTKSESQVVNEAKTGSTFALIGGIVLAAGGIVVAVMGFLPQ